MAEMQLKEALDVIARHGAETRNPSMVAAVKHIEAGLDGQHEQRPSERHDSPGMQAAKRHMRSEFKNPPHRDDRSHGQAAAARAAKGNSHSEETSDDE